MNDPQSNTPTDETHTAHIAADEAHGGERPGHVRDGADPARGAARHRNALEPGTKLLWYSLDRVLGHGAFGITYLAADENLHRPVAIKEYLPGQFATRAPDGSVQPLSEEFADEYRTGLQSFISEARTLAQLEHPSIVRVHNVFEANDTAYLVMQYEDGEGLDRILKRKRTLDEHEILRILGPLLAGLEYMHARGFVHRDIKPANVFIRRDGSPVLLDFGSARQAIAGEARTLTNFVSPGYAPIEQYAGKSDQQGPWSDIYGLGATIYRAMTGHAPPDAVSRSQSIAQDTSDSYTSTTDRVQGDYSPALLGAVDRALQFRIQDRPQDIADWRGELPPLTVDPNDLLERPVTDEPTQILPRRGAQEPQTGEFGPVRLPRRTLALAAALFASLAIAGAYFLHEPRAPAPGPAASTAVPAPPAAPAAVTTTVPPPPVAQSSPTAPGGLPAETVAPLPPPGPAVGAAQPEPQAARNERIAALLAGARADLDAQRLTTPAGQNALEKYREVLSIDPKDPDATRGLTTISDRYLALCNREIERGDLKRAESYLAKAEAVTPQRPAAATARELIAMKRQALAARGTARPAPPPAPAPASAQDTTSQDRKTQGFFESLGKLFSSEPRSAPAPVEDRSEQFRQKLGGQ